MSRGAIVSAALAGALMAGIAAPASAVTFYYNAYGGFVVGSDEGDPAPPFWANYANENDWYKEPVPNNNSPAPEPLHAMDFSWGSFTPGNDLDDPGRSGVRLLDTTVGGLSSDGEHIGGQVQANGELATAGYVTHYNEPNPWAGTGTVDVHWHIDLFDGPPVPGDFSNLVSPVVELTFRMEILETPNREPCPDGSTMSVCDDRLRVTGFKMDDDDPFETIGEFTDVLLYEFNYEGTDYDVLMSGFFEDAGLENLAEEFWSGEGEQNTAYVGFRVVPEPSTAVLLGLGFAGLGWATRRRGQA